MFHQRWQIGAPPTEIVVHIDNRDAGPLYPSFELRQSSRHCRGRAEELVRLRKIKIVNYVNNQQRDLTFVRRASMKVGIAHGHQENRRAGTRRSTFLPNYSCGRARLFDLLLPSELCPVAASLPPPRLRFVPLGFFPELRHSPGLWPGRDPDRVSAPRP
jgi:hypothetical protein